MKTNRGKQNSHFTVCLIDDYDTINEVVGKKH